MRLLESDPPFGGSEQPSAEEIARDLGDLIALMFDIEPDPAVTTED
jgi:hypothetical protein